MKSVFVTVGTTKFDILVEAVTKPAALSWMATNGFTHLVIQYGKGLEPVFPAHNCPIKCASYSFLPSLEQDMRNADLILSHAGAGTVMEALRLKKKLVVIINTLLMDNHQTELAHAMAKRGHLFVVEDPLRLNDSQDVWEELKSFVPVPHAGGDENDFAQLLNAHMGIVDK